MWTFAAGAVVATESTETITVAVAGAELELSPDAAADLSAALEEATTGRVPDEPAGRTWPQAPPGTHMGGGIL